MYNINASQRRQPRILTSKFSSYYMGCDGIILDFEASPNHCEEIYQQRWFPYNLLQSKWQAIALYVRRMSISTHVGVVKVSSLILCNQDLKVELKKKSIFAFTLRKRASTLFINVICKWISIFFFKAEIKARKTLKIYFFGTLCCFGCIPKTWL